MPEIEIPEPFPEYEVEGIGTVVAHEGDSYHARTEDGRKIGWRAQSGTPSEANAAADFTWSAANPRVPSVVIHTPLTVISRLTDAERVAIFTSTVPAVCVWRAMAGAAQEIRSDDPRTAAGFALLESEGILAEGRAAVLMAP
jgi:hypothetical protein